MSGRASVTLKKVGPVIAVSIGISQPLSQRKGPGAPNPPRQPGDFLVDTGADVTAVDLKILRRLGVQWHSRQVTFTAAGWVNLPLYDVSLEISGIPGAHKVTSLMVAGVDLSHAHLDGLLGRDVINTGLLTCHGPTATGSFDYF